MTDDHDILTTDGFATVVEPDDDSPDDALTVHGVLVGEGDVSHGLSGTPTRWPGDVLREYVDDLEGTPITLPDSDDPEQHVGVERDDDGDLRLQPSVPLEAKAGEITAAQYVDGVGLAYEATISHPDAEQFVERGVAHVSPVTAHAAEPDPEADDPEQKVATRLAAVRDVGMVSKGGMPSNSIATGPLSTLTSEALAGLFPDDAGVDAFAVDVPEFEGFDDASWERPSLEATYDGDVDRARNGATWVRGDGETMSDLSLFVVDGDDRVNVEALDSAWRLASQTDGVDDDAASELRAVYARLAGEAREAGAIDDETWGEVWADRVDAANDPDDVDGTGTDANAESALPTDAGGLRGAMARRVARSRASDKRTIKDGARSVAADSALAHAVLGKQRGETVDDDDQVARQALDLDDDDEERDRTPVDVDDDPVAQAILGLDGDDADDDGAADA